MDEPTTGLDPQAPSDLGAPEAAPRPRENIVLTTHSWRKPRGCARACHHGPRPLYHRRQSKELILRHIEPHVVEVHGDGVVDWTTASRKASLAPGKKRRYRVLLRGRPAPLLGAFRACRTCATCTGCQLEDVFLKLTGRELRD